MRTIALLLAIMTLAFGAVACEDTLKEDDQPQATITPAPPTATPPTCSPEAVPTGEAEGTAVPTVDADATVQPNCLVIIDIVEGTGAEVTAGDTVTVHYTGWLSNGTIFDATSRHTPPDPAQFSLSSVIKGWQEGIPGMKVGGKRRLVIPPSLAYGEAGSGGTIPPNATLTFDVELVSIP
jgi:FKBP-type peptidyl-prolyl cis-trans isomerase FkpA